jgi:hypothetical protein
VWAITPASRRAAPGETVTFSLLLNNSPPQVTDADPQSFWSIPTDAAPGTSFDRGVDPVTFPAPSKPSEYLVGFIVYGRSLSRSDDVLCRMNATLTVVAPDPGGGTSGGTSGGPQPIPDDPAACAGDPPSTWKSKFDGTPYDHVNKSQGYILASARSAVGIACKNGKVATTLVPEGAARGLGSLGNDIYALTGFTGLPVSHDGGRTWSPLTMTLNGLPSNCPEFYPFWMASDALRLLIYGKCSNCAAVNPPNPNCPIYTAVSTDPKAGFTVYTQTREMTAATNADFVAVGPKGWIGTSADGASWTTQGAGATTSDLFAAAKGGALTIAVGDTGTILSSADDGVTWTPRTSKTTSKLLGVGYNGTTFAAVGEGGTIVTSSDGVAWTAQTSNTTAHLRDVTARAETFFAGGDFRTLLSSPDGVTWTVLSGYSAIVADFGSVVYGGGTWVAVDGAYCCAPVTTYCQTACPTSRVVATSPDGVKWTQRTIGVGKQLTAVAYGASTFVTVGDVNTAASSADGITWVPTTLSWPKTYTTQMKGVAFGAGVFVAVGYNAAIFSSPDGKTWTFRTSPNANASFVSVLFDGARFVAMGSQGEVVTSTDGITWTSVTTTNAPTGVSTFAFGASSYVAEASGSIWTSPDAAAWTARTTTIPSYGVSSISFAAGTFVAVGYRGIFTSPDGLTWASESTASAQGAAYGNGTWMAVGSQSTILSKP